MQKTLKDLIDQQGRAERLKNFRTRDSTRQSTPFLSGASLLCCRSARVLEFDKLNDSVAGFLVGQMAWVAIPFSALVSWIYVSLDHVGESTENPFEGGANDVPITYISRLLELELREMLGESRLLPLPEPQNGILL
jgi:putative membrane protein